MKTKTLFLVAAVILLPSLFYCATASAAVVPTANAGPDLYVDQGQTITLQGSGYDSEGSSLTYYWNCSGGTLSNYSIAQPVFTAPSTAQATYNCSLTVTNSYGLSATDSMTVYVNSTQVGGITVQTNSATNIQNNQATLQGYVGVPYLGGINYVWFQWGTTTSYGSQTNQQTFNNSGSFSQNIANLSPNTTYHYRAAAQNGNNTVYGQDMTFNSSGSSTAGTLSVSKKVINLTSGNLNWQTSVNAKPGDVLSFVITIQTGSQEVQNVFVKDVLPQGLIYKDSLMVNATLDNSNNPANGINLGTVEPNGTEVISYQAQVSSFFGYGTSVVTNTASVTSNNAATQTASSSVAVTNTAVSGATIIATGLSNKFLTESFFLPLLLIVIMSWLYFTGKVYRFADWLKVRM